jgi:hypothetical protein
MLASQNHFICDVLPSTLMSLTQDTDTRMNNRRRDHKLRLLIARFLVPFFLPLLNNNRKLFLHILLQVTCDTVPLAVSLRTTPRFLVLQEITQALILSMTGLARKQMAIRHPVPLKVRGQISPEVLDDETNIFLGSAAGACP